MNKLTFSALSFTTLALTGCYNMRTNVKQPIAESTFWEDVQRNVFLCHDCRAFADTAKDKCCDPICYRIVETLEANKTRQEKMWEDLKVMQPFHPKPVGIRFLDDCNVILSKLSEQIITEVVVPYGELDKHGLIAEYNVFIADYNLALEEENLRYGERPENKRNAMMTTWSYWQKEYGAEYCAKLHASIPHIRNLQASNQFGKALANISGDLICFGLHFEKGLKELKAAAKTTEGKIAIGVEAAQTLTILGQLNQAIAFYASLQTEKASELAEAEEYLKVITEGK